jgi:hypothetical protein
LDKGQLGREDFAGLVVVERRRLDTMERPLKQAVVVGVRSCECW